MGNPRVTLVWQSVSVIRRLWKTNPLLPWKKQAGSLALLRKCAVSVSQTHWWDGQWKSKTLPKKKNPQSALGALFSLHLLVLAGSCHLPPG